MSRHITIDGDVARIPLTQGYVALIDAADVPLIEGRNWSALISRRRKAVYAVRVAQVNGKQSMLLMHRVILGAPPHLVADHIDGDGLNNRRSNLRTCTRAQNTLNVGRRSDNKSGFKGVFFETRAGKWRAEIRTANKARHLGYFDTAELAADAYRIAAARDHGEFARVE